MGRLAILFLIAIFFPNPTYSAANKVATEQDIEGFAESFGFKKDRSINSRRLGIFANRGVEAAREYADLEALAHDSDVALDRMVNLAAKFFERKKMKSDAKDLLREYNERFAGYFSNAFYSKAVGDHQPISEWLDRVYVKLEKNFGQTFMEMTRLKDLKTFNFCIPVVFQPRGDRRFEPITPWEREDYIQHFVPFAGAVTYWATWGSCTAATWGLGWVTFVCSIAGNGAEHYVMINLAPKMGGKIWDRYNEEQSAFAKILKAMGLEP